MFFFDFIVFLLYFCMIKCGFSLFMKRQTIHLNNLL